MKVSIVHACMQAVFLLGVQAELMFVCRLEKERSWWRHSLPWPGNCSRLSSSWVCMYVSLVCYSLVHSRVTVFRLVNFCGEHSVRYLEIISKAEWSEDWILMGSHWFCARSFRNNFGPWSGNLWSMCGSPRGHSIYWTISWALCTTNLISELFIGQEHAEPSLFERSQSAEPMPWPCTNGV